MIKCVLLDFGGVIYKIDHAATILEFSKYSRNSNFIKEVKPSTALKEIFLYESGKINLEQFRSVVSEKFDLDCTAEQFDLAWNKILVEKYSWAEKAVAMLKENYKVYLLSNTNEVHFSTFEPECRGIFSQMDGLFLSYKLGGVKPEEAIYKSALQGCGFAPEECVFADDLPDNLHAAEKLGINTRLISDEFTLLDFAKEMRK